MSERIQKKLSQLVKMQLGKKSSKTSPDVVEHHKIAFEEDVANQKQKMEHVQEDDCVGAKVSEEERFLMHIKLLLKNIGRFVLIGFYCVVATVAVCKAGIIILTAFQEFLRGIFIIAPPTLPKS